MAHSGAACPSCSEPVRPDDRFCGNCRFQLRPAPADAQATVPKPAGHSPSNSIPSIGEQALQLTIARQRLNTQDREADLGLKEARGYLGIYQDYKRGKQDLEVRDEEEKLRLERERIEALSGASLETLISISGDAQTKLLAEVAQVRELQGFSPDQILTQGAVDNPDFAAAHKDLLMGLSANGDLDRYERLVSELKESASNNREDYQRNVHTMSEMFHKAVDSLRATSVALGGGGASG